jgi:adenylyltransferase/sulfurtransferase
MTLARSSLARLTLVDPDRIERSNLQRQVLFDAADVGRTKVDVAAERLATPGLEIARLCTRLDAANAMDLIAAHDFVIDACDDPATKFSINSTAVRAGVPFSYGGVTRTSGLTMTVIPGATACLECVFPGRSTQAERADGCQDQGILAPVAGVIGSLQACHALAVLEAKDASTAGRVPAGRLFVYEIRSRRWRVIDAPRARGCGTCNGDRDHVRGRRNDACHS